MVRIFRVGETGADEMRVGINGTNHRRNASMRNGSRRNGSDSLSYCLLTKTEETILHEHVH